MSIDKTPATNKELKTDRHSVLKNSELIKSLGIEYGNVLNRSSLIKMLKELKEMSSVSEMLSLNKFVYYLTDYFDYFEEVSVTSVHGKVIKRYVSTYNPVSPYEIALSIYSNAFLSHYSAIFAHDLTLNNPKTIYINREQTKKPVNKENAQLTQRKVDYAFNKEMRRSNNIYKFKYNNESFEVIALNGKNTNNLGINNIKIINFSKKVRVTNIERSLIDITVRPQYSGGVIEVLEAFYRAKDVANTERVLNYLEKIDYIYPYQKSIMFYMIRSGYPASDVNKFKNLNIDTDSINFYLDYQIIGKTLDSDLGIFYPKELDNLNIENLTD